MKNAKYLSLGKLSLSLYGSHNTTNILNAHDKKVFVKKLV